MRGTRAWGKLRVLRNRGAEGSVSALEANPHNVQSARKNRELARASKNAA